MYSEARGSVELFVANMTLEMLGFLVKNEYLFIVKFTVAIPVILRQGQIQILFNAH